MKNKSKAIISEVKVDSNTGVKKHIEHFDDFEVRCFTFNTKTRSNPSNFKTHRFDDCKALEDITSQLVENVDKEEFILSPIINEDDFVKLYKLPTNSLFNGSLKLSPNLDPNINHNINRFEYGRAKCIRLHGDDFFSDMLKYIVYDKSFHSKKGLFILLDMDISVEDLSKLIISKIKDINKIAKDVFFSKLNQKFTFVKEINSNLIWIHIDYSYAGYFDGYERGLDILKVMFENLYIWDIAIKELRSKSFGRLKDISLLSYRMKYEHLKCDFIISEITNN